MNVIVSIVFFGLSLVFGYLFYAQNFKWRDCFNELGRCYDAETGTVYLEQSGAVWLSLTALTLGVSLYQIWRLRKQCR